MDSSTPQFISIGEVLAPHGTNGHFKVRQITDFPKRFSAGSKIYIDRLPFSIEHSSFQKSGFIIKINGIDNPEDAANLRGKQIEIDRSQLKSLANGQYYHFQLTGLEVFTDKGEPVGRLKQVLDSPGNDIYVVEGKEGEILIPAVEDVIKLVDVKNRRIVIEAIDGLLDLNRKKAK